MVSLDCFMLTHTYIHNASWINLSFLININKTWCIKHFHYHVIFNLKYLKMWCFKGTKLKYIHVVVGIIRKESIVRFNKNTAFGVWIAKIAKMHYLLVYITMYLFVYNCVYVCNIPLYSGSVWSMLLRLGHFVGTFLKIHTSTRYGMWSTPHILNTWCLP